MFDAPEQASAAYESMRKHLLAARRSEALAADGGAAFEAAKEKARAELANKIVLPEFWKRQEQITCPTPEMSDAVSAQACYPHNPPSEDAAKCYQGKDTATILTMMHAEVPQFQHIVNYPTLVQPDLRSKRKRSHKEPPADETKRGCVMCGRYCLESGIRKVVAENQQKPIVIPERNRGICTACVVTVWVHSASGLQIKWCTGCRNFKTWAAFGLKGHLTRCMPCRKKLKAYQEMAKKKANNADSR